MGSEVGSEVVSGVVVGGVTSEVGEVTGADVVDGLAAVMTKVSTMNGKKEKRGLSVMQAFWPSPPLVPLHTPLPTHP